MATPVEGTFWVCSDCLHANVNGEEPIDRPATEPETWALWAGDDEREILPFGSDELNPEDTGEQEFSWRACEGCGSTLAGSRFRFAWLK